jgi:hypothetical protein
MNIPSTYDIISMETSIEPCRLLQLPRELRNQIFEMVFADTRLTFGEKGILGARIRGQTFIIPAKHSLALLSVCQQINAETRQLWIRHVLFNFYGVTHMINKLLPLPDTLISQIRYLRLFGHPRLRSLAGFHHESYMGDSVFSTLPALHLNCLTVVDSDHFHSTYDSINDSLNHGNGWKRLQYITPTTKMLGRRPDQESQKQRSMTACEMISLRDGEHSGAFAHIYMAKKDDDAATIFRPHLRDLIKESTRDGGSQACGMLEVKEPAKRRSHWRAVMLDVKRGRGAATAQIPFDAEKAADMQARLDERIWKLDDRLPRVHDRYSDINEMHGI